VRYLIFILLFISFLPTGVAADTVAIGSSLKSNTQGKTELVVTENSADQYLTAITLTKNQFLFGEIRLAANETVNGFTTIKYRARIEFRTKGAGIFGVDRLETINVNRDLLHGDYIRFSRKASDIHVDQTRTVEIRIEMYSIVTSATLVTLDFSIDTIIVPSGNPVLLNRSMDIELIGSTSAYPKTLANVSGPLLRYVGKSFIFLPAAYKPGNIPSYNQSELPVDIEVHIDLKRSSPSTLDFLELNIAGNLDAHYLRDDTYFSFKIEEVPYDDILDMEFKYEGDRADITILDIFLSFPSLMDPELYEIERTLWDVFNVNMFGAFCIVLSAIFVKTLNETKLRSKLEENKFV
jgi:hypothetical protein